MISCLFSGITDISFGISNSTIFSVCIGVIDLLGVVRCNLLPIKSPVAYAVFCIALFGAVLSPFASDCLALSRCF